MIICYVRIDKKKKITSYYILTSTWALRVIILFLSFITLKQYLLEKGEFYRKVDDSLIGQRIEKGMLPEKEEKAFLGQSCYQRYYCTTCKSWH